MNIGVNFNYGNSKFLLGLVFYANGRFQVAGSLFV